MNWFQRTCFEHFTMLGPLLSALVVGFAVIGADGVIRITPDGEAYLVERERYHD